MLERQAQTRLTPNDPDTERVGYSRRIRITLPLIIGESRYTRWKHQSTTEIHHGRTNTKELSDIPLTKQETGKYKGRDRGAPNTVCPLKQENHHWYTERPRQRTRKQADQERAMKLEAYTTTKAAPDNPPRREFTERNGEWVRKMGDYMEAVAMIAFALTILVIGVAWTATAYLWIMKTTNGQEQ